MKFILKILFAPVIAILAVVIWIFALMLKLSAWVFGIINIIFLFCYIIYHTKSDFSRRKYDFF